MSASPELLISPERLRQYSGDRLRDIVILFTVIDIITVSLRFLSLSLSKKPFGLDDLLAIPALLFCLGQNTVALGESIRAFFRSGSTTTRLTATHSGHSLRPRGLPSRWCGSHGSSGSSVLGQDPRGDADHILGSMCHAAYDAINTLPAHLPTVQGASDCLLRLD